MIIQPKLRLSESDDEYEREAERVADAVVATAAERQAGRGGTTERAPVEAPRHRLTTVDSRIQRQDNGPHPEEEDQGQAQQQGDRNQQGPHRQGPRQQGPPQQGAQQQGPHQGPQQQGPQQQNQQEGQQGGDGEGGGRPMDLNDEQINKFTATVKAEAGSEGQEEPIRWVYYNLVHRRETFEEGLSKSSAYDDTHFLYRYYVVLLEVDIDAETDALGDDVNHRYLDTAAAPYTKDEIETVRDYVNDGLTTNRTINDHDDVDGLKDDVESMFEAPTEQQYAGFTGQGNQQDLNGNAEAGDTLAWQRARRYYRLWDGSGEKRNEDSDDVQDGAIQVVEEGGDPQVLLKWEIISDYFSNNQEEDPQNWAEAPPEVEL